MIGFTLKKFKIKVIPNYKFYSYKDRIKLKIKKNNLT